MTRTTFSDLYFVIAKYKEMYKKNIHASYSTSFLSDVISVKSYLK